jgi:hypothetical protein
MTDFFDRLDKFMKSSGLNDNKLTVETGISNGLIGKGRKRGSLSQDNISKILHTYKDLNANWLLTGEGKMLKSDADSTKIDAVAESKTPSPYITNSNGNTYKDLKNGRYIVSAPVVPFYAYGRYLSDFADEAFMTELDYVDFIVDHIGRGKYVSFEIKGDSMDDGSKRSVPERSLVLCRELEIDHWREKLHYRKFPYWIIVHKTSILCKQIIDHNVEKGTIKCHSLNSSPEYQDFEINLNEVKQLLNIIKIQKDVEFV